MDKRLTAAIKERHPVVLIDGNKHYLGYLGRVHELTKRMKWSKRPATDAVSLTETANGRTGFCYIIKVSDISEWHPV